MHTTASRTEKQRKQTSPHNKKKKTKPAVSILGPVEDLESYVKAEWWKDVFNSNYLKTDGDVVNDSHITDLEINRFIRILKPNSDSHILDLCCGHGRHTIALAKRGYKNVTGLDRSHYLIKKARKQASEENLTLRFREGDARKLPFKPRTFDFVVIPGNSFGYFESAQEDHSVLSEIARVLKPGGQVLLDLTDGDYQRENYQPRSWEWIDKNYFVCRERCLSDDKSRLISREVITHTTKGVVSDQFYAERLYSQKQIETLLSDLGYRAIKIEEPFSTNSVRNQDLGMMQQRYLCSARAPDLAPSTVKTKAFKNIAVIMGDPSKRDTVKPGGEFDDDDFVVIDRLRSSLSHLNDFQFTYFTNHDQLLSDSAKIKNEFDLVFNLCDEGFQNQARQELHIPALLEMLDIPYTGGTPQCLGFCYDKSLVRGVANEMDIPTPQGFLIQPDDSTFHDMVIDFPVLIKPNLGDSSIGITQRSVCRNLRELTAAIHEVRSRFDFQIPILVEQFLEGADLTVGFIGNLSTDFRIFPVVEEDYSALPDDLPAICGYEAKWDPDSPYWQLSSRPANLPEQTEAFLINSCQRLFERLECRDYARFDWRVDSNGTPRLLEVNPNPGWCWDGHLAKMAKLDNIDYGDMLGLIIKAAIQRHST